MGTAYAEGKFGLEQNYDEARRWLEASLKSPPLEMEEATRMVTKTAKTVLASLPKESGSIRSDNSYPINPKKCDYDDRGELVCN